MGLIDYSVGWASGGSGGGVVFGPPTDLAAWEEFVSDTAKHFKGRIAAYEVWNEPDVAFFWNGIDGGDPDAYFELLSALIGAIKPSISDAWCSTAASLAPSGA